MKREKYYELNNINLPSKENAILLMTEISHKDIVELKRMTKVPQAYEEYAKPFLHLFDIKIEYKMQGIVKTPLFWESLHKFMISHDLFKLISEFEVETVSKNKFLVL